MFKLDHYKEQRKNSNFILEEPTLDLVDRSQQNHNLRFGLASVWFCNSATNTLQDALMAIKKITFFAEI